MYRAAFWWGSGGLSLKCLAFFIQQFAHEHFIPEHLMPRECAGHLLPVIFIQLSSSNNLTDISSLNIKIKKIPEVVLFLGIVSWRLQNFWLTLPRGCLLSWYCYPEVKKLLRNDIPKFC